MYAYGLPTFSTKPSLLMMVPLHAFLLNAKLKFALTGNVSYSVFQASDDSVESRSLQDQLRMTIKTHMGITVRYKYFDAFVNDTT